MKVIPEFNIFNSYPVYRYRYTFTITGTRAIKETVSLDF
jgi:hypothetical protein